MGIKLTSDRFLSIISSGNQCGCCIISRRYANAIIACSIKLFHHNNEPIEAPVLNLSRDRRVRQTGSLQLRREPATALLFPSAFQDSKYLRSDT